MHIHMGTRRLLDCEHQGSFMGEAAFQLGHGGGAAIMFTYTPLYMRKE